MNMNEAVESLDVTDAEAPTQTINLEADGFIPATGHTLGESSRVSQGDGTTGTNQPASDTTATGDPINVPENSNQALLRPHLDGSREEPLSSSQPLPRTNALEDNERDPPRVSTTPLTATLAPDDGDDVAKTVREKIIRQSVVADVSIVEQNKSVRSNRRWQFAAIVGVVVLVALVVGLSIHFTRRSDKEGREGGAIAPSSAPSNETSVPATLVYLQETGFLRCGVYTEAVGFALLNETTGRHEGVSADLCRAFAAIVFDGDVEKVEFVPVTSANRYELTQSGVVDLVSQTVTHNMERDIVEPTTGAGFHFSAPFYYSGLGFGGLPEYVDCAENLDSFFGECRNLRICVGLGSTQEAILRSKLPGPAILALSTPQEMFGSFATGLCNCLAADPINMPPIRFRQLGYDGPYKLGTKLFSHDPLCLMTADVDPALTTLVDLAVHILITAETESITRTSANSWGIEQKESGMLDETLIHRVVDVVSAAGNLGEIYNKHMEAIVPRSGVNLINTDPSPNSTGLLYSYPYGDLTAKSSMSVTGTISSILEAGKVKCAVVETEDQQLRFHDEFCKALSAALFRNVNSGSTVYVSDDTSAFDALENGDVDVVIGGRVTLESLGRLDHAYSIPTFYDKFGDAFALVTSSADTKWSDLVNWLVIALIDAEEKGISKSNSGEMPTVPFFGEELGQMFRDCIAAVGNVGDIFNRTLSELRTGRNRLSLHGPQHFPVPFQ